MRCGQMYGRVLVHNGQKGAVAFSFGGVRLFLCGNFCAAVQLLIYKVLQVARFSFTPRVRLSLFSVIFR